MLDRATWISDIKTRMGYPVVNLAIKDEMINQQCEAAIRKVVPYLNSVDVFTVSSSTVKFKDKLVYAVLRVHSTDTTYDARYDALDDIYRTNLYYGSLTGGSSSTNLETVLTSQIFYNTLQETVNDIGFRLAGDTLYIDGQKPPYTVEAITEKSVENMPENLVTWCFDYSLALVKICEAQILGHVKIQGQPVETNAAELRSEGNSEKQALEDRLGTASHSLFYCMR